VIFGREPDWDQEVARMGAVSTVESRLRMSDRDVAEVSSTLAGEEVAVIFREIVRRMLTTLREPDLDAVRHLAETISSRGAIDPGS
jgi:hypothetical protein